MTTRTSNHFEELLVSHEFLVNPYPVFDRLRDEAPVYWSDVWRCWVLTSYEGVTTTFKEPNTYQNANRFDTIFEALPEDVQLEVQPLQRHFQVGLINSDPPDHTRMRNLVHKAFTPRRVREMRGNIQAIVDEHLDKVQADGSMDVIQDLAYPLPVIVIATILGVPAEDHSKFKHWSDGVIAFQATGRTTPTTVRASQTALLEMRAYFKDIIAQRRQDPRDDLITALIEAEEKNDRLTLEEMLSTCVTMLIAGHETTTNLIGNAIHILLNYPDEMQALKEDPSLIPGAVEEVLRFESPLQRNRKIAARDMEFGGQFIKKGQLFLQMLGAANRDPAEFETPAELNIYRQHNPHVAFGMGVHFCLGAPLARLEAPVAIQSMLERMPQMRQLQPPEWQHELSLVRGLKTLPIEF